MCAERQLRAIAHQNEMRRPLVAVVISRLGNPCAVCRRACNFSLRSNSAILRPSLYSAFLTLTGNMSSLNSTPLVFFKRLVVFLNRQDGSQTLEQLLPSAVSFCSTDSTTPYTKEYISEVIRKSQNSVRRFRLRVEKRKRGIAAWEAVREQLANTRLNSAKRAKIERDNAAVIAAPHRPPAIKPTSHEQAEQRLVRALGELRARSAQRAAEAKRNEEEAKRRRKEERAAEKRERHAKAAAENERKKRDKQELKNREAELLVRQTDVRAQQALDAAARHQDLQKERIAEAQRRKAIDGKLQDVLDLMIVKLGGRKRKRSEEADESDSDKENVEPEGEWQV